VAQTQVLSIRLTLEEVAKLSKVAICPCCKQRISKPTTAAQAILRAALASDATVEVDEDVDEAAGS
jgi:hypothetical protein